MPSYRKTMRQAREEMLQSQNENNLDEGKMSAAQIATLKKAYEPMRGKKISMASGQKLSSIMDKVDDDKQALIQLVKADIPFVSQLAVTRLITKHGMKGAEIRKMQEEVELDEAKYTRKLMKDKSVVDYVKSQQEKNRKRGNTPQDGAVYHGANWVDIAADAIGMDKMSLSKKKAFDWDSEYEAVAKKLGEEVELDEAKYDLYHKDFSSAMQHSYKMAKKLYGITVDPKEIDDKVASGPRKPSEGKTNKYRLKGDKGAIQVQVYNKGGSKPFELNMYKEEVELDEKENSYTVVHVKKGKEVVKAKSSYEAAKKFAQMKGLKNTSGVDAHLMEEVELGEARQLKDPKKEMMVKSKDSGVIVIDKKDFKKYQKKGYFQVEGFASDAQRKAAFASGYKEKGKKGKKESILDRIDKKLKERKNG